jgi:hypothetical protein
MVNMGLVTGTSLFYGCALLGILVATVWERADAGTATPLNEVVYIILRCVDVALSFSLLFVCRSITQFLTQQEKHLKDTYHNEMLVGDMFSIRRRQLYIIALAYMVCSLLALGELGFLFAYQAEDLKGCSAPCMTPKDNIAALI